MLSETEPNNTVATAQTLNLGFEPGQLRTQTVTGSLIIPDRVQGGGSLTEPNGSIPTAFDGGIVAGQSVIVNISTRIDPSVPENSDVDFVKVPAAAGFTITVSAPRTAGFDPKVIIYDELGNIVAFNDNDPRGADDSSFAEYLVPETGNYYVSIQPSEVVQSDPFDANSVTNTSGGTHYQGFTSLIISVAELDYDHFNFEMKEGEVFAAAIDGDGSELQLIDPDGNVVDVSFENRSAGFTANSPLPGDQDDDASLVALALQSGTYTLRVSSRVTTDYELETGVFHRDELDFPLLDAAPFLVNTETGGSQFESQTAAGKDGSFSSLWRENTNLPGTDLEYSIRFQQFDGVGGKVGNEKVIFEVDPSLFSGATALIGYPFMEKFDLLPMQDGTFLFVYVVRTQGSPYNEVFARALDSAGNSLSQADVRLSPVPDFGDTLENSFVIPLAEGGGLLAWYDGVGWQAQVFDADLQEIGNPIEVAGTEDSDLHVTQLLDGNLLFSSQHLANDDTELVLRGQIYDQQGVAVGGTTDLHVISHPSVAFFSRPHDIVNLSNGNLAVVWKSDFISDSIWLFDATLAPITNPVPASGANFQLVALNDGGFAAFYLLSSVDDNGDNHRNLVAAFYNYDGTQREDPITITENLSLESPQFSADTLDDGKLIVSWSESGGSLGDASFLATHAQIIDPGFGPGHYVGTDGSDVLHGRQFDDVLEAGAGDDTLVGWFGADTLTGGSGSDTFVFTSQYGGPDEITDFVSGEDTIEIGRKGFSLDLALGELAAEGFVLGGVADAATPQFLYDSTLGTLRFDEDGTGDLPANIIAFLGAGTALSYTDIQVTSGGTTNQDSNHLWLQQDLITSGPEDYFHNIRDYDGNYLGAADGWFYQGQVDIQNDGDLEYVYTNETLGRWATIGPDNNDVIDFAAHGFLGDTRVVGIYIDPLVADGTNEQGGPFDSQQRFRNDLEIDNLRLLGADDYDTDGFQEMYFRTVDGTAYLRALMHADGNIQYANYQSEQQMIDYLTSQGFDETTWQDWIV